MREAIKIAIEEKRAISLLFLIEQMEQTGQEPSIAALSEHSCMSAPVVRRVLDGMVEDGTIELVNLPGRGRKLIARLKK